MKNTKTAKALRRITKRKGVKTGPKLYNEIPGRDMVAKIIQLRTGHCGLNHYLHRFGKRNSPYCECGMGKETVEHYLLDCRRYKDKRHRKGETKHRKITRPTTNDKAYGRVHQEHKAARTIRVESRQIQI